MKFEELGGKLSREEYLMLPINEQLWRLYDLGDKNVVPDSKTLTKRKQLQFPVSGGGDK